MQDIKMLNFALAFCIRLYVTKERTKKGTVWQSLFHGYFPHFNPYCS